MTHDELCDIAVKWLQRHPSNKGHGCHVAVSEVKSGFRRGGHQDGSVVVEVKVSRADFLSDAKKPHRITGGLGNWRYYMTPLNMVAPEELPDRWGLIEVNSKGHVKPIVGPVTKCKHYHNYNQLLSEYRHNSDTEREIFILVRLLSRFEDANKENGKIKKVYNENISLVRQVNHLQEQIRDSHLYHAQETRRLKELLTMMGIDV